MSLEDSDNIKLETNLEAKSEPLEPISESVPCELFTADSDVKEDTADEEDIKPVEEEGDTADMGVPLHVEEGMMDFEKPEDSQDIVKFDDDDVNLVPERLADDLPDLDQKQQYDDEPSHEEITAEGDIMDKDDTMINDDTMGKNDAMDKDEAVEDQSTTAQLNEEEPSKAEGSPFLANSATIDPSYAPENEELLYEGDVENDNMDYKEGTPVMDEATAETTAEENREQDLSLVLDLHVSGEMEDLQAKEEEQTAKGGEGADKRLVI